MEYVLGIILKMHVHLSSKFQVSAMYRYIMYTE